MEEGGDILAEANKEEKSTERSNKKHFRRNKKKS